LPSLPQWSTAFCSPSTAIAAIAAIKFEPWHTGVLFQRFQKRFCLFNRFDALFTRSKGKYIK
jgi:hypothetical protein